MMQSDKYMDVYPIGMERPSVKLGSAQSVSFSIWPPAPQLTARRGSQICESMRALGTYVATIKYTILHTSLCGTYQGCFSMGLILVAINLASIRYRCALK